MIWNHSIKFTGSKGFLVLKEIVCCSMKGKKLRNIYQKEFLEEIYVWSETAGWEHLCLAFIRMWMISWLEFNLLLVKSWCNSCNSTQLAFSKSPSRTLLEQPRENVSCASVSFLAPLAIEVSFCFWDLCLQYSTEIWL